MIPDDNWAKVELYRWQYGELPNTGEHKPLNISKGLENMADALEEGYTTADVNKMPSPFNVCEVLRFCARKLNGLN